MTEPIARQEDMEPEEERQARTRTGMFGCLFLPGVIMVVVVLLAILYLLFFRSGGA